LCGVLKSLPTTNFERGFNSRQIKEASSERFSTRKTNSLMRIFMTQNQAPEEKLTKDEESVIVHKATEAPFTGKYFALWEKGTYVCKRCGTPLYRSENKFEANCGWPSFDEEIHGAVVKRPDPDGARTEISCAKCGAHLGHVFVGEGFTKKYTRHCVNSISMEFIPDKK
jgi:methionine-R-sulfoxide reductase